MMKVLNSGRWLPSEETFVDLAITCFFDGILDDCPNGTTLRQYIARRLNCDEMRITKKLRRNKTLAGRRYITCNYNRKHFTMKHHITIEDLDQLNLLKFAYLQFEADLRLMKGQPALWDRMSPATRVAIPALLNEL